jgi:hypothetical protein
MLGNNTLIRPLSITFNDDLSGNTIGFVLTHNIMISMSTQPLGVCGNPFRSSMYTSG